MSLAGTWIVVASPDFNDAYLHMAGQSYVRLEPNGNATRGQFYIGLQTGEIYGGSDQHDQLSFSFAGSDEMEPIEGDGTAELQGERLLVTLTYQHGDEFTFVCERQT